MSNQAWVSGCFRPHPVFPLICPKIRDRPLTRVFPFSERRTYYEKRTAKYFKSAEIPPERIGGLRQPSVRYRSEGAIANGHGVGNLVSVLVSVWTLCLPNRYCTRSWNWRRGPESVALSVEFIQICSILRANQAKSFTTLSLPFSPLLLTVLLTVCGWLPLAFCTWCSAWAVRFSGWTRRHGDCGQRAVDRTRV